MNKPFNTRRFLIGLLRLMYILVSLWRKGALWGTLIMIVDLAIVFGVFGGRPGTPEVIANRVHHFLLVATMWLLLWMSVYMIERTLGDELNPPSVS